ncbi:MAG: RsmD family RNA methyltransferase [Candidatus Sericytochromatia bacterium]|uniref:RsmD family RNA methyltransferase n=1 Tax=Candidatus Tanganyikabacteria bacterium TaxID=2961651 RepID=A0A938BMI6_9BACT|nr:RsmD family RNA methyltransferase [Candidatus Tanganyikabacteria bacterium]
MIRIIAGSHKNRPIKTVPGDETRPTSSLVRKALFDIVRDIAGGRVLDLFSGTGAIALEALSRGAAAAVAIESAKPAVDTIRANAAALGLADRLTLVNADVLDALRRPDAPWSAQGRFALIYADPPYSFDRWDQLCDLAIRFLNLSGILAVEHGDDVAISASSSWTSPRDYRYGGSVISVMKPLLPI